MFWSVRSYVISVALVFVAAALAFSADLYTRGKSDLDAKRYAEAERELAQAEVAAPGKTNAPALRAKALVQLSRFEEAEACLSTYLAEHPDSGVTAYLLAYVQFRRDQPAKSLASYTAAARLQRPGSDDFKVIGLDYVLLNDYADGLKWLHRAVEEDPRNAEAYYHLGRVHYVQNQFDPAIDMFERAIQIQPIYPKAEAYLGLAYAAKNLPDRAEAAYRSAIQMNDKARGKTPEPYIDLADLLSDGPRRAEAIPLLNEAEQIGGKSARTEEIRGRILLAENRLPEAEIELRAAISLNAQNGSLHYLLGRVLKKEGKAADADREFAATRQLLSNRPQERDR